MDLEKTYKRFSKPLSVITKSGKKVGMHLHDHSEKVASIIGNLENIKF